MTPIKKCELSLRNSLGNIDWLAGKGIAAQKKVDELQKLFSDSTNHKHHAALHFMHYNICWIHQTLRVTPAMEAGITEHVWTLEEVVALTNQD